MAHTCRGTINLGNATVTCTGSTTFVIANSSTQTFHLKATSEAEQKKWVSALQLAKSKAASLRKQGDDSDAYTEGDEDNEEYKTSTLSADSAMRLVNQTLSKMEKHLVDLHRHQETLSRKGEDLQKSITEMETARDPSEMMQRFVVTRERATVYKVASMAMVNSCTEFMTLGRRQSQRWQRIFFSQRERCSLLEQMIEELAKQLRQLELLVKQNNPHATLSLPGFGSSGNANVVAGLANNSSLVTSIPGQAVRVDSSRSDPNMATPKSPRALPRNAASVKTDRNASLDAEQVLLPTVATTVAAQHGQETVNQLNEKVYPGTICDSSDEDFFDAEEVSSEFLVYLPSESLVNTSSVDSASTSAISSDSRSWSTGLPKFPSEDDGSIPTGTDVAFEYESDVDFMEGDDGSAPDTSRLQQAAGVSTATKGLREARVILTRARHNESRSATLVSTKPSGSFPTDEAHESTDNDKSISQASKADTAALVVPRRKRESKRRTRIPYKPNYSLNLWSIMKNCIGKELTKIPMPVNFSEPLSMLQRLTEDFEYSDCLDRAAACTDSLEQMVHVAAFTVSSYASTAVRVNKPFNPLLGETYECDRTDDLGWRSLAEQVSHHPPKCALHCETNDWYCWFEFSMNTKFRGKYLQINPVGMCHLVFRKTGNHYTWQKIPMTVHNIIVGRLWIDNSGEMDIVNHSTGEKCHLSYKAYSYFSSETPRRVTGAVTDRVGDVRFVLNGTWDDSMEYAPVVSCRTARSGKPVLETGLSRVVWCKSPLPPEAEFMYNFTTLGLQLNESEPDVCPTDCRFRPDQRLMEVGRWDEANREKVVLEEKQRNRRRQMAMQLANESLNQGGDEENGGDRRQRTSKSSEGSVEVPVSDPSLLSSASISSYLDRVDSAHKPSWFEERLDPDSGTTSFHFNDKYWNHKATGDWSTCPDIY